MKRIRKSIYLIPIMVLIVACSVASPMPTGTATNASLAILLPTTTTIVSTPSPLLELTPSPAQGIQINTACPTYLSSIPPEMKFDGQFVLRPINSDEGAYLLDFATKAKTYLPYTEGYYVDEITVSPNYQWVAYFTKRRGDTDTIADFSLVVTDLNGNVVYQENMDITKKWYLIDTWLDDQTLMLERYQTLPESNTLDTPLPVTIFNPFTGESRDMDGEFPNMLFFFEPLAHWDVFGKSGTAYDPMLELVAYASESRDDLRESVVLWDLRMNREIARIQAAIGFGSGPVWSPDGSQFIIDSLAKIPDDPRNWTEEERLSEEIFSLSRTGEITRLTYLTDQLQEVSIGGYVWSPDGSRIAFYVSTKPDVDGSGSRLAILDTHTKQVTIYCISGYQDQSKIFWSPNGTQLLIGDISTKDTVRAVVLDIDKNVAIPVADDVVPVGWMVAP